MQQKLSRNTVIIYSSARKNGNTAAHVKSLAEQNELHVVCLDEFKIPPYSYSKKYTDDEFFSLFESLLNYDHWVFASPVYWYSTTTQMKTFIDRITDYMDDEHLKPKLRLLRSKDFSLLSNASSSEAPDAFVAMFKNTFSYLGMRFLTHHHKSSHTLS